MIRLRLGFSNAGQIIEVDEIVFQPLSIRLGRRHLLFDFIVADDPPFLGVDQKHAARLQAALFEHALRRDVEHAHFRSHDHQIVLGHIVARRAQTVTVKHGADHGAVGKSDGRRPVPGLHQAAVVFIEGALFRIHALMIFPRLGNHHHHRVGQGAAAQSEKLEGVIELRRVAAVFLDDRKNFLQIVAKELRRQHALARVHPVLVAAQRVDLAVMDQIAIGMGPAPAGKSVGAKARVDDCDRRLDQWIGKIGIERRHLARRQHALIDQRAARHAWNIEELAAGQPGITDRVLGAPANHE